MKAMGLPIFLTSLTTIIAFLSMFYAPITQLMGYGIVVSFGIFLGMVLVKFTFAINAIII